MLTNLENLLLNNNLFTRLPEEVYSLKKLKEIDIAMNRIISLPQKEYAFLQSLESFSLYNQVYEETLEKEVYSKELCEFQGLPIYTQLSGYGAILTYELIAPSTVTVEGDILVKESGVVRISKDALQETGLYQLRVSTIVEGRPPRNSKTEENKDFKNSVYIQNFTVSERVVVNGITGLPAFGTVGEPLVLEGVVSPENASHQEIIWTIEDAGTTEAILEGNTLVANKPGIMKIKATIVDGLGQGVPYEQIFEIDMIQKDEIYRANPDRNTVSGLKSSYKENEEINFTAIGDGKTGGSLFIGDERYTPVSWSINPNGTWTSVPYTATTKIAKAGEYQLQITYNKEVYDGTRWIADGTSDVKSIKVVVEKKTTD